MSPLHHRLREATSASHLEVERALDLLSSEVTREHYRAVVRALYGYYEPLESRIASVVPAGPPRGFAWLRRAPLLADDLAALGYSSAEVAGAARCEDLPRLELPGAAAGCLYVVEGAALGGQVIRRALERRLGITASTGASFFFGEGPLTAARWRAVLEWIEACEQQGAFTEGIIESARQTFQTFASWMNASGAGRGQ